MKNRISKTVLGALVAVAAFVGAVQPANATVIAGSWDPAWGGSKFVGLGWNATAQFNVPTACLSVNGNHLNDGSDACTGGANQISFSGLINVNFYDDPNTASIFETHSFSITSANITSIDVASGQITGITTVPGNSSFDAGTTSSYTVNDYNFQIFFNGPNAYLNALALVYFNNPQECTGDLGCVSGAALGEFSNVPEPGSLALLSSALVGLGMVRRRRQQ